MGVGILLFVSHFSVVQNGSSFNCVSLSYLRIGLKTIVRYLIVEDTLLLRRVGTLLPASGRVVVLQ